MRSIRRPCRIFRTLAFTCGLIAFTDSVVAKVAQETNDEVTGLSSVKDLGFREHNVWQGFKGLLFGGAKSSDEVRAIALNPKNGRVLLAGTSKPWGLNGEAWGSMAAGDVSGGSDIFFAQLTDRGELAWVRRAGSLGDEDLQAMVVTKHAAYLCGTTTGNFGSANAGEKDIFVTKYSLTGEKLWERAAQFGTERDDVCKSIETSDEETDFPELYISGWTGGALFQSAGPTGMEISHRFLARLIETGDAKAGNQIMPLRVLHGTQRGSIAMSSGDAVIRAPNKRLFLVSNQYNASVDADASATSIVELYDTSSLSVHKVTTLRVNGRSFFATRAAVQNGTGNLYVVGIGHSATTRNRMKGFAAATLTEAPESSIYIQASGGQPLNKSASNTIRATPGPRSSFYAVRYTVEENGSRDTQLWGVSLGQGIPTAVLSPSAKLSVAVDTENELVHITGVLDGLFLPSTPNGEGFVSSPLMSLFTLNGSVASRVMCVSSFPQRAAYMASSTLSADGKSVIYAGTATKPAPPTRSVTEDDEEEIMDDALPLSSTYALVGSLGSTAFVSQLDRSAPVEESLEAAGLLSAGTSNEAQSVAEAVSDADAENRSRGSGGGIGTIGAAAIGVAAVGAVLLAAVAMTSIGRKSGRRIDESGFVGSSKSVRDSADVGKRPEPTAGGSSAPQ